MSRLPILLVICLTPIVSVYVGWRWPAPAPRSANIPSAEAAIQSATIPALSPSVPQTPAINWENWSQLPLSARRSLLKPRMTVQLVTAESPLLGQVLASDELRFAVLSTRGSLHFIPWQSPLRLQPAPQAWQPLSAGEMATELAREFGPNFQLRGSAEFVVVQPRSSSRDWARSMQQFYGNIQTYCSARQIRLQAPRFPLVAIVLPNRQAMLEYARQQREAVRPNFRAYYGLHSNRIVMYDSRSPDAASSTAIGRADDELDLQTVFHETFHQVAFNTGLHRRTLPPPLWVSEGMATAFESPGMADHRRARTIRDRVHRSQWQLFREYARQPDFGRNLAALISHDDLFQERPTEAYAIAWAVAFYWMEQSPQAFSNYLERINRGPAFSRVAPEQRLADFQTLSQCSLPEFQQRLVNYYDRLP